MLLLLNAPRWLQRSLPADCIPETRSLLFPTGSSLPAKVLTLRGSRGCRSSEKPGPTSSGLQTNQPALDLSMHSLAPVLPPSSLTSHLESTQDGSVSMALTIIFSALDRIPLRRRRNAA